MGGESTNLTTPSAVQQSSNCTGVVLDAAGAPLAGVAVSVKGTTNGVSTDLDGKFTLSDVKAGDIIVVQSIGYKTVEMSWNGGHMDIFMEED